MRRVTAERELLQVWTTENGSPDRLVVDGRRWRAVDRPTLWIGRTDWWTIQGLERPTARDLEVEMWSFRAVAVDDKEQRHFDIARDRTAGAWWLVDPETG